MSSPSPPPASPREAPQPAPLFDSSFLSSPSPPPIALVVLNSNLPAAPAARTPPVLARLLSLSAFTVCADGGANRLFRLDAPRAHVPEAIVGDLDSLLPEVREHYESLGTLVVRSPEQDRNDLEKSLLHVLSRCPLPPPYPVCVYGGLAGRLDQTMASLSSLVKFSPGSPGPSLPSLLLLDEETTARVLPPTDPQPTPPPPSPFATPEPPPRPPDRAPHRLRMSSLEGPLCGLLPLTGASLTRTTGLRWDLDGTPATASCFGGLVSSSNEFRGEVEVESDQFMLWTTHVNVKGGE